MDRYIIDEVPKSVYYIPNFITESDEKLIIQKVNNVPKPKWTQLSNRRLQNWGGIPHPKGMISETIPSWLQEFIDKVANLEAFDKNVKPNHVLINEYLPGQGIMPHFDGPLFYPTIATISCGSHTILHFTKANDFDVVNNPITQDCKRISLLLEPRSLLILQDSMYHDYQHCIDAVDSDVISDSVANLRQTGENFIDGQVLERSTRISLTIRHVPKTSKLKINFGR
ncbi:alpha-ketoglutarate-dependent dioxygenase alkB homolog 6-like [Macrosteles quadrilineatus]|uniref:alpha-ketoglutarate-dependent dioxygenase alkB homolog 6-like n=1 Tax=Macrosteles quadrilineatus TaxID=74068 RepID=UPI0023E09640|nr:alpha-ketoglutarate-dependent dioxygenase alkB homolog 6-like [Macrosteles quadrilineatus]XP_054272943.1 alpha-ketoglutarate-dependent dioxygenase alkB homolog 6-like [Macrosteles quadrilineatus]